MGPHAAPANRRLTGVVGLDSRSATTENALAYDAGVNVVRAFPGRASSCGARAPCCGGAAAPAASRWPSSTRGRCLSAIARTAEVVGQPLVFEPNSAILRIKLHQLMTDYLLRVFQPAR